MGRSNFNGDEQDSSAPKIKEDKMPLQKVIKNFEEDEFDACRHLKHD